MRIVVGVTGGIAAYKSAEVIRSLRREGAEVHVIMTRNSREFITPLTLQVLSGHEVVTDPFDLSRGADIEHISLVRESDLFLVAPATADILAKFARGVADDFLSTFYTAYTGPVVVAPAMNGRMWSHLSVQDNLAALRARGVTVIEPEEGELACGEEGVGRLADPPKIVSEALRLARRGRSLAGERVLVSAGPTREPLDPVRYLSNRSSGKMGYALAGAARRRGAGVTLVTGPVSLSVPWGVDAVRVETSEEMAASMRRLFPACTICLMVAAVSDFRAARPEAEKIRRADAGVRLDLAPTEDILDALAAKRRPGQLLAGFAAETGDPEPAARRKLSRKGIDVIFANDVTREGAGFDVDTNILVGLAAGGERRDFPLAAKATQADRILDWIEELRPKMSGPPSVTELARTRKGRK